jgi:hypothetical protein
VLAEESLYVTLIDFIILIFNLNFMKAPPHGIAMHFMTQFDEKIHNIKLAKYYIETAILHTTNFIIESESCKCSSISAS